METVLTQNEEVKNLKMHRNRNFLILFFCLLAILLAIYLIFLRHKEANNQLTIEQERQIVGQLYQQGLLQQPNLTTTQEEKIVAKSDISQPQLTLEQEQAILNQMNK